MEAVIEQTIERPNLWGRTALMTAVNTAWLADDSNPEPQEDRERSLEVIRLLLAHGADTKIKDRDGINALKRAEQVPEVLSLLRKAAAGAHGAGKPTGH